MAVTDPKPFTLPYRIRNTADHFVAVGDELTINDIRYVVKTIEPVKGEPQIITYGLRCVSEVVDITVEPA